MKEILVERRDALRQAISGDNSLLKKLSQKSGGDVVDFASDSAVSAMAVTQIFRSLVCRHCPTRLIASSANWLLRKLELNLAKWSTGV